ncbi:MAG: exonuclease SbcCD subunit D [Bacillota bacterium]|nr:exonuclease SbcCD subunit D [Bacillota bacterium]
MKFLHVSDLHIGKVVNDFSMLEEQRFILDQISGMAVANKVEAVVIAGDIYDRAIPPGEAVTLFDAFLTGLVRAKIQVVMISGNHDSPERISFGGRLFDAQGVHIAGVAEEALTRVKIEGEESITEFVLLPFIKSAKAGAANSAEAVEKLLDRYWEEEKAARVETGAYKNRVLVTHYFVTDAGREPELSDSETTIHVGGLDNVDASLFTGFDYVALGHIHKPQQIGDHPVWYAGSLLKYSFGEVTQSKCALLVTMGERGLAKVRKLPLHPLHDFRKIKGSLKELLEAGQCAGEERFDYLQAILTDRGELIDPMGTLRSVYPNMMQIIREEKELTGAGEELTKAGAGTLTQRKDALALFEEFYRQVREEPLSEEGKSIVAELVKELEG